MRTLCFEIPESQLSFGVQLHQTGKNKFTVIYGKQVESGLSYSNAATELGRSIMHALACGGKLDNEGLYLNEKGDLCE